MKYFLDTEFIEGFHKPLFGKRRHFIDLVSIGIVSEDGRAYYAISEEFDVDKASQWVLENVIAHLDPPCLFREFTNFHDYLNNSHKPDVYQNPIWKSNKQIAKDIKEFIGTDPEPVFIGYYADYDWVLLCSLFGTMEDLPENFPKFCIDTHQMLLRFLPRTQEAIISNIPIVQEHHALYDAHWIKNLFQYLKPEYHINPF